MGGVRDGGIAGVVVALAVELGLDQVDLDLSHSKRIRYGLRVGEVRQRRTHDGDGSQRHTQENYGKFLFHVCFAPFM